ncbi:hypothetical protein THAOC_33015 [Thalassiosira oceanica]|uniref:Mitogen-activated protein kinase n=1 Tax=Thalassiosira oceanica TaxID=159749 RepID=K0R632_THAOC|nr:hypothetical protein THAOC_33015 [Thalassiosira oceanica]|eukprot:EJK48210.1 hypothetical protein THAOC_33015 [Thalassiosira oceanica]
MLDKVDARVLDRFCLAKKIGSGAYGIVWKAVDEKNGKNVALKKCFDCFRNQCDAQRTYRECKYLRELTGHENIVELEAVLLAETGSDIYLSFNYMESDLSNVIKAGLLESIHIKFIAYQLLKALKFIHSASVVHRDLKPANVLIDTSCRIKVADFGLSRSIPEDNLPGNDIILTDYISTRWYRPPEVLVGSRHYSFSVDLFSVGCIIAEMFRTQPLMQGSSSMDQLERIFELCGNPRATDIQSWRSPSALNIVDLVNAKRSVRLDELCPNLPKEAKKLVEQLLSLDPTRRGTAASGLEHEYLEAFHDPSKERVYPHGPVDIGIDDGKKLTPDAYRQALYSEFTADGIGAEQKKVTGYSKAVSYDSMDFSPRPT